MDNKKIFRVGFALFHGHGVFPGGYLAAYCARRFGARSYVGARGNDVERGMFAPAQFPFLLWTLRHADAAGGVSRELVEKCRALELRYLGHHKNHRADVARHSLGMLPKHRINISQLIGQCHAIGTGRLAQKVP